MTGLLSDVAGPIRRVLMALPDLDPDVARGIARCQAGILDALGPDVGLVLLQHTGDPLAGELGEGRETRAVCWDPPRTLRPAAPMVRLSGDDVLRVEGIPWADFTPWVQDICLVTDPPGVLLVSPRIQRTDGGLDEELAAEVARALGWRCDPLPRPLDGANVLCDAGCVFLGGDQCGTPEVRDAFARVLGPPERMHVLPRDAPQPLPHQDLYLALAGPDAQGRPVAVVGSEALAADIAGGAVEPMPALAGLDGIADELDRLGFRTVRAPVAAVRPEPGKRPGIVSCANVLVEVWGDGNAVRRRVTLGRYGVDGGEVLAALDAAAAEVWQGIGFAVRFAEGPFTWLSRSGGGVRCLTRVLLRGP